MTHLLYLIGLLVGIAGLLVIDRRLKLAFWHDAPRTWGTLLPAVAVFVVWDFLGIALGIFAHGTGAFNLPFVILPEFPLEEPVFLFLLTYTALLAYRGGSRLWPRT